MYQIFYKQPFDLCQTQLFLRIYCIFFQYQHISCTYFKEQKNFLIKKCPQHGNFVFFFCVSRLIEFEKIYVTYYHSNPKYGENRVYIKNLFSTTMYSLQSEIRGVIRNQDLKHVTRDRTYGYETFLSGRSWRQVWSQLTSAQVS